MSNYRDDVVELAWVSEATQCGFGAALTDELIAVDAPRLTLSLLTDEGVGAGDAVEGHLRLLVTESGRVGDGLSSVKHSQGLVTDTLRGTDVPRVTLLVWHEEAVGVTNEADSGGADLAREQLVVGDALSGHKRSRALSSEDVSAGNNAPGQFSVTLLDTTYAEELWRTQRAALALLVDTLATLDATHDQRGHAHILSDGVYAHDRTEAVLHGRQCADEELYGFDTAVLEAFGQAWVSAVDNWGMSRYVPYTFSSAAVLDDVPYATGVDGVYRLNAPGEVIAARLYTGLRDVGGSPLTLPAYSYVGYDTDGTMTLGVTQTQSGVAERWDYPLDSPPSEALRNGRFIFGRGLRARYFDFELLMRGTRGTLDDWTLVLANKSRRL